MFSLTKIGDKNVNKVRVFVLDDISDLEKLPTQTQKGSQDGNTVDNDFCGTGSSAFIISTSQSFMLNSKGIWCELGVN